MNIKFVRLLVLLSITSCVCVSVAPAAEVTVAGFAFAGEYKSAANRFPHSFKVYEALKSKTDGTKNLSIVVTERTSAIQNQSIDFKTSGELVNLKESDQALMVVLLLSGETVSTEKFATYYKTFVNLRGDALIFDYKNQTVVRSYPVSVVLFDATNDKPSNEKIQAFVSDLIFRTDNRGLISQFTKRLETAALPLPGTKSIQVRNADILPEAMALLPESLRHDPKAARSMLADSFGSILSAKLDVPMLPNSIGHAVGGEMSMRLENGDDYKLKLGEGDYLFDLKLNKFAKIKTAENNVSTSYVYGAYANVLFYEPTQGTNYINSDFKNGENAIIPSGQVANDDFPAYQDAIRGMFLKLADALQHPGSKWITTAASAKDVLGQMDTAREIFKKCK